MGNVVQFFKGESNALPASDQRSADALYFTTDTHRIYLGDHEYSYYLAGSGIAILNGTISIDKFDEGDIDEICSPLPTTQTIDLNDVEDVSISNATNNQSVVYDAATGNWVNGYPSAVKWASF